jgi:predicted xylose isomerase-like sugar epimerase
MPGAFEINLTLGPNTQEDVADMQKAFAMVEEAFNCGAKGLILGQLHDIPDSNKFIFTGKFVHRELVKKILELAMEAE